MTDKTIKLLQPKSDGQRYYQQTLDNKHYNRIVTLGPAGSGKTLLACQKVAKDFLDDKIGEIVLVRSLQPVEGENDSGYLPGSIEDKLQFWMQPILFHLKRYLPVKEMIANETIKFYPLEMLRGTSFESDTGIAVIATEIQNISLQAYKCLLSRIGKNARLYCDGDTSQADRGSSHSEDFLDICWELEARVSKFKLVQMTRDDVFRDKDIKDILDVFQDFDY